MMTVVDQVSPWLTPSRTLATTTQPQVGAQISSSGTGTRDQPAGDEHRLAAVAVRPGPGEEVGDGLDDAERDDEGQRGGEGGEVELASASSGRTVRSWPIIPPTSALTATSSANWARFSRSPSRSGRPRVGRAADGSSSAGVQRGAVRGGPVVGATVEHGDVAASGALEDAGGGHRPLAVPAHHRRTVRREGRRACGEVAELDVGRAGDVPGVELGGLADVERARRPSTSPGSTSRVRRCRQPGRRPARRCRRPARRRRCRSRSSRPAGRSRPGPGRRRGRTTIGRSSRRRASRARWRTRPRSAIDSDPGTCPAANVVDRAHVDDHGAPPASSALDRRRRRAGASRGRGVERRGPAPVDLGEAEEVGGEGAEPAEQRRDERRPRPCAQQRVGGPLTADAAGPLGARRGGAERPGAVGRVDARRRRAG